MTKPLARKPATGGDGEAGALTVRAVERAVDVLFAFVQGQPSLDVLSLQRLTDLPRPTLYRLLHTLETKGLIYSFGEPKRYQLGHRMGHLAHAWKDSFPIVDLARGSLGELWKTVQETVTLMVPVSPTHRICAAELKSPHAVSFSRGTGYVEPSHRGASGKVLLAFAHKHGVAEHPGEPPGPRAQAALRKDLLEIRRRGYAVTYGEVATGIVAVAAPILDADRIAVASVCAFAPQIHMNDALLERCIAAVKHTAATISARVMQTQAH